MKTKTSKPNGLYRKYKVTRTDGSTRKGRKHAECAFFVLDLACDPFARPAMEAYLKACRKTHPSLAADLESMLAARPCGCRSVGMCPHIYMPQTMSEQALRTMGNK